MIETLIHGIIYGILLGISLVYMEAYLNPKNKNRSIVRYILIIFGTIAFLTYNTVHTNFLIKKYLDKINSENPPAIEKVTIKEAVI